MGFIDFFTGGGSNDAIERLEDQLSQMQEAANLDAAARKTMNRRLEDLTYKYLDAVATNEDDHPENRRKIVRRAYRYWAEDPIVGQSLNLLTWYTFGRGVPMPTIPKRDDVDEIDRQSALDVITEFWNAPENKAVITSLESQEQKSLELQIEGEVFIAMFDGGAGSPLLLSDIDPSEITNVIVSTDNRKMPLYYERTFSPKVYDFATRQYRSSAKNKVVYYRHWLHEPGPDDPTPPNDMIDESALVMHVAVNRTSNQQRGNSEVRRVLEWAKGFREFMEGRLAIARAINRVAQVVKVDGGPSEVAKVMQQFSSADPLALTRIPLNDPQIASPQAATMFRTPNVSIEPASFETGAGVADQDKRAFLGQIAAGTGWPSHYLGGEGAQSLANLTAMEAPVLKMVESRQELWEQVIYNLTREALIRAGIDVDPEVTMPPILQRDTGQLAGALQSMVAVLDPQQENIALKRWIAGQYLSLFGEANVADRTQEIVDESVARQEAAQQQQPGPGLAVPDEIGRQTNPDRVGQTPYGARSSDTMAQNLADPTRTDPRTA
jgi:hypothetical protein